MISGLKQMILHGCYILTATTVKWIGWFRAVRVCDHGFKAPTPHLALCRHRAVSVGQINRMQRKLSWLSVIIL